MTQVTNCNRNRIKIGAQQSYKNFTMFPLLTSYSIPCKCLTMMESLSKCNNEQNRLPYNTIRNLNSDRITTAWDYIEQFARVDGQIGAIFLINGKLAGLVYFQSPEAFKKSFIKIVESYAKKADDEYDPKIDLKTSKSEMINFLKMPVDSGVEIQSAAEESNQILALNSYIM